MIKTTQTLLLLFWIPICLIGQDSQILTLADQMPYFFGCKDFTQSEEEKRNCSNLKLISFISSHLQYPEEAKTAEIEGTVYVSFVIDEYGNTISPSVLMDIGGGCGEAALDVLKQMPLWEPGIHEAKKVKVKLNLPIQFSLKNEEANLSENYNITWGGLKGAEISKQQLQENIIKPVYVRNPLGDALLVDELTFQYAKKKRQISAKSRGQVSTEQQRLIEKVKKGGIFTIFASIQDQGEIIDIRRSFQIIDQ